MSNLLFENNATSTLAGAISDVATSANLAVGTGARFPSPTGSEYFVMTFTDAATGLLNEIVHVTARTGDVITIVRAQEGTTALAWNAGDLADSLITAGQLGAMVQTTDLQESAGGYAVDTGSANSIVATLSPAPTSYADLVGAPIRIKVAATNTGATVVNLNGLGSKNLQFPSGGSLSSNALSAGGIATMVYDGAQFQLQSVSTSENRSLIQYVASGTSTVPGWAFSAIYTITAAGGSGAGCSTNDGGAGGAGETRRGITQVVPGSSYSYTVPTAQPGGAAGTIGNDGGDCVLVLPTPAGTLTVTAKGGQAGQVSGGTASGGGGGTGGSGGAGITGGAGGDSSFAGSHTYGGMGGASYWGGGGRGSTVHSSVQNGYAFGSGGGGSYGGTPTAGGDSAPGVVEIMFLG